MTVYFNEACYAVYSSDPAASDGRMQSIVTALSPHADMCSFEPANHADLLAVHPQGHMDSIRSQGLFGIAALAAGGAIQAAETGMQEPCFAIIRPPGHHASAASCWGFCFFNNMAISLMRLRSTGLIDTAFILDFDLHYGDGTANILEQKPWVELLNPDSGSRRAYLDQVQRTLATAKADVFAVSAGFDNHEKDWGGLLTTEDYGTMGKWVRAAAERNNGGCYGILEGGYNHEVLGVNVLAFVEGMGVI